MRASFSGILLIVVVSFWTIPIILQQVYLLYVLRNSFWMTESDWKFTIRMLLSGLRLFLVLTFIVFMFICVWMQGCYFHFVQFLLLSLPGPSWKIDFSFQWAFLKVIITKTCASSQMFQFPAHYSSGKLRLKLNLTLKNNFKH